jgi:FAD dependent oxidoreductase TIGR03364
MGERRADVLVVGGGALGCAHAVAAVRAGLSVTVCERDAVARGASVRNFGMIWPIGQPAGEDLATALRSRALWGALADEAGFSCRPCGSLHVAYADDELAVLQEFQRAGTMPDLRLLTPEEARAVQPALVAEGLRGALHSPHEANVDPGVAISAVHGWLRRQGVVMRCATPVAAVRAGGAVLADGAQLEAERVVICTGEDFSALLPEVYAASDLVRCRLQMAALAPPHAGFALGPMLAAGLTLLHYDSFAACPALPALRSRLDAELPEHRARGIHVLVSQGDDGRLIVGDSHDYRAPFEPGLDALTERLILDQLATFFAPAGGARLLRRWSGCYAKRRGGASVFRAEPIPGVEVVTGVGGSGMTRSLALGEQTVAAWRSSS